MTRQTQPEGPGPSLYCGVFGGQAQRGLAPTGLLQPIPVEGSALSRRLKLWVAIAASIELAVLAYVYLFVLQDSARGPAKLPGHTEPSRADARPGAQGPAAADSGTQRPFAADSVWNAPLPNDTPLDPQSDVLSGVLRDEALNELRTATGPYLATKGGVPVYTVPRRARRVRVKLDVPSDFRTSLKETFAAGVPIPATARPADNPDQSMVVWQPSTDRMWEFFRLQRQPDGWHARWGGAIRNVSLSDGRYQRSSWPGASARWGATATSLALIGGLILTPELRSGHINHAIALSVGTARQGVYSWPAQRTDGVNPSATAIPEGARFRLDPTLDLSKRKMPRITRALAVAAQRYGIVVTNQTGQGLAFWAEDPTRFGINARSAFFDGLYPTTFMRSFPWDHLQLLRMRLHRSA